MEPTKELNATSEAHPPPSPSPATLDVDADFCDSLLNSVPDAVCKSGDGNEHNPPAALDAECVSLYDSFNMESAIMPDFDALDLDCLDLECFLSTPVPLAC